MAASRHQLVTELIIDTLRVNGRLVDAGDSLVADLGITSASWRVLGEVTLGPTALPVAHLARNMGLTRQAVQRVVDILVARGLVRYEDNPHHARARLVVATDEGRDAYDGAMRRQRPWAIALARGIPAEHLTIARDVIRALDSTLATRQGDD